MDGGEGGIRTLVGRQSPQPVSVRDNKYAAFLITCQFGFPLIGYTGISGMLDTEVAAG